MTKPREMMEPYTFDAELSLARMSVAFAGRHKDDPGCAGLVHQVRRLEDRYRRGSFIDRAAADDDSEWAIQVLALASRAEHHPDKKQPD